MNLSSLTNESRFILNKSNKYQLIIFEFKNISILEIWLVEICFFFRST